MKEVIPMFRSYLWGFAAVLALAHPASAQTVDEVIAKNIEAKGGLEKIKSVQTLRMIGKMTMGPGIEAPATIEFKRPNKVRMEITVQGNVGTQAYDGKNGWSISPFSGKKEPEPMSAEDLKDVEEQSDMDGPLVDYKAKGHTVELLGKEKVEGSDAYKLKVTLKNGDVRYIYLDADAYLEIRAESKRTIRGSEVEVETTIGDYKEVDGLLFPHSFQSGAKGRPEKQNIVVEKIEINPEIEDGRFEMPAASSSGTPKQD
jgi:outer membrane lipoprotein-sorting protein